MGSAVFLDKEPTGLGSLLAGLVCSATEGYALGGKSAGGRSSVRSGGPARSSGHRGAGAIPGEAGVRGCHTGSTATTPPAQHAARPRHSEHRARAAPGSSAQRDQILTRFLPRPRH